MQNITIAQKERYGHSSALIGDKVYIFGGLVVSAVDNNEQIQLTNTNDLLEATVFSCCHYQSKQEQTVDSENGNGDGPFYNNSIVSASATWTEITGAANTPSQRNFHSCVVYQDKMYIFGGKSNGYLNDLHMYDPQLNTWTQLAYDDCSSGSVPDRRYGHSACVINGEMFVFGGYDSNGYNSNELMALDLTSLKWRNVALKGDCLPSGRHHHSMSECGQYLFIYGGINAYRECLDDLYVIDTETGSCIAVEQTKDGRYGHMSFCNREGDKYLLNVIGGCTKTMDLYNDSFIFEMEAPFRTASLISTLGQYRFKDKTSTAAPCNPVFCTVSIIPSYFSDHNTLFFFGGTRKNVSVAPSVSSKDTEVDSQFQSLIHDMPDDIGLVVLSFLNRHDLCTVSNVSKNWRFCQLSEHNIFWEPLYKKIIDSALYEPVKAKVLSDRSTDNYKKKILLLRDCYRKYVKKRVNARKADLLNHTLYSNQDGNFHEYVGIDKLKEKFAGITTRDQVKKKFGVDGVHTLQYDYSTNTYKSGLGVKIVVVGDGATGKTCLLIRSVTNDFPEEYVPTVFDNYSASVNLYGDEYSAALWDTAGPEDYDRLRPLSYPHTNIFLLCFSVINPWSLINIYAKWVPEVMHHCPNAVMVLIGTKVDLREDPNILRTMREKGNEPVSEEEGIILAKQQKCAIYLETSARTGKNLNGGEFFELLIQTAIDFESKQSPNRFKKHGKCVMH